MWPPLTLRLSKGERDLGSTVRAGYGCSGDEDLMAFWVYILRCADASYYVGHTETLELRVAQHQSGDLGGYTSHAGQCSWCTLKALALGISPLLRSDRSRAGVGRRRKR